MERIIAVMALWRDSSKYLTTTLYQLDKQEINLSSEYKFFYSFYENDSIDNTPELLSNWIDRHDGVLLSEKRNDPRWKSLPSIRRTKLMAEYRNLALRGLKKINFDYLFVLDTDIIYENNLINKMINILDSNSTIGMITPNTTQDIPDAYHSKSDFSYYDSWALIDIKGNNGLSYASNPFILFEDRNLWNAGLRVNVQSAFGGAALIRGNLFENTNLRWYGDNGCEHWNFCAKIRNLGYEVSVDPLLESQITLNKRKHADLILVQYDKSRLNKLQLDNQSTLLTKIIYTIRYIFFRYLLLLKNIFKFIFKFLFV